MPSPFVERTIINGSMLRQFTGKNISIMLRVIEEAGSTLSTMSTDGQEVQVRLPNNESIGSRKGNWVEVIGTPTGNMINAKETFLFNDDAVNYDEFDTEGYNMLAQFLNNAKDLYTIS